MMPGERARNDALPSLSSLDDDRNDRKRPPAEEVANTTDAAEACPYLDSVERTALDFDLEPACSVSLETGPHIYGCLVCGRFFRGRGPRTAAYTHSVEESHFVFVHLGQGTFWCLPDGYEIRDPSLNDIRSALRPTFSSGQIEAIDLRGDLSRDLFGRRYLPGFVGLNNLKKTDCINSVVQALAHVPPLRDFFLAGKELRGAGYGESDEQGPSRIGSSSGGSNKRKKTAAPSSSSSHHRTALAVTQAFGELVRKMWSPSRFRSTVDPHLFVQAVSTASQKRFEVGRQSEAGELLAWLLHQLHVGTGGGKKPGSSVVHRTFQGEVRVTTRQARRVERQHASGRRRGDEEVDDRAGSEDEDEREDEEMADADQPEVVVEETTADTHFLQLTLEIPEKPLFRDEDGGLVIPQEPFVNVLKKFDGVTFSEALARSGAAQRKRYELLRLPSYLILHLARFRENKYSREKNPAIVTFPIKNFDLTQYVHHPDDGDNGRGKANPPTAEEVRSMSIKDLKALLERYGRGDVARGVTEKHELVEATVDFVSRSLPELLQHKYDLCANITHGSPAEVGREGVIDPLQVGSYKCHVQHRGTQQWYEIQDLHVQEIMPQQIGLTESNVLIFERKTLPTTQKSPSTSKP